MLNHELSEETQSALGLMAQLTTSIDQEAMLMSRNVDYELTMRQEKKSNSRV